MSIVRPSGRKSFRILVTPIHRELFASAQTAPAAIVFIVDPERPFDTPIDMLAELFALSRAEARLGVLLLQDRSLGESAQELGVSLNTVRTQLKKLFEKTGTNRQRTLIRALLLSPAHLTVWSQMTADERQDLSDAVRTLGGRALPPGGGP